MERIQSNKRGEGTVGHETRHRETFGEKMKREKESARVK